MIAYFFDIEERRIADSTIFETFLQETNSDGDTLTVRGFGFPENAEYVGFFDRKADFQLYHIVTAKENEITHELSLYCEIDLYELVTEKTITDIRPTNTTAGFALEQVLKGTRFEVGNVVSSILASTRFYYCSPFTALRRIESIWGVRAKVRYNIRGSRIANRYVDLVSAAPIWRGKRFEIGKDILSAEFTVDKRNVVTALTGRGKGESVGDGYGRRIGFSDVVWSKGNGDPADKPAGQEWIEDPEATALYGVCGKHPRFSVIEFDEIEDPEELLRETWNALQDACAPLIYGSLSSVALDAMGFPHEAAHYGDEAAFITSGRRLRAQIVGVKRDYARNGADEFQFGALTDSSARQIADVKREINTAKDKANAGAQVAQKNESLLQGYIDTMKTQILSTGTKLYTDQHDGGLVLESADGKSAVKLTGSGILIASTKTGDDFQWTLAIDGHGAVADTITTGVLNASIVKIFGTSAFYWDSANIHIVNPEDTNRQIRIGLYDGAHYGIGFTTDGGQTWQNAIGFDGVSFSAKSIVSTVRESAEYKGDMKAMVKQTTFEQNARDVTAIFNRIGLDGAQTGIVKADIDGVKVSHSDFNGYTQQAKDGFKMYDGNGNLIGGMFAVNGTAVSGVQRLLNPSRTTFFVEVSPGLYADEEDGLRFYYGNAVCGILTGIWDSDGDGNGSMRLRANDTLYIGDKNGQLSVLDLIKSVNRVHYSYSQPSSANAGDIWLKPINVD